MQEVGEAGCAEALKAQKTKENPTAVFITEKDFYARLKKGEKFTVSKTSMEKCTTCNGKNSKECKPCRGRGDTTLFQTITYTW